MGWGWLRFQASDCSTGKRSQPRSCPMRTGLSPLQTVNSVARGGRRVPDSSGTPSEGKARIPVSRRPRPRPRGQPSPVWITIPHQASHLRPQRAVTGNGVCAGLGRRGWVGDRLAAGVFAGAELVREVRGGMGHQKSTALGSHLQPLPQRPVVTIMVRPAAARPRNVLAGAIW